MRGPPLGDNFYGTTVLFRILSSLIQLTVESSDLSRAEKKNTVVTSCANSQNGVSAEEN